MQPAILSSPLKREKHYTDYTLTRRKFLVHTPEQAISHASAGDWTEDSCMENGNYTNTCVVCKNNFIGHKRRVVCKGCNDKAVNCTTTTTTCEELSVQDEVVFIDAPDREPTPNELRVQGKLQALAAMAALGAATVGEGKVFVEPRTPRILRSEKKAAFGVCVGRDNGRDPHAEQPRNQPCRCGSGKKAKKCCKTVTKEPSQ